MFAKVPRSVAKKVLKVKSFKFEAFQSEIV